MPHFGSPFDPRGGPTITSGPQPLPRDITFPRPRRRTFDPTAIGTPLPPLLGGGGSGINPQGLIGNLPGTQPTGQFGTFDPNTSPIFGGIDSDVISDLLEENPQATFSSFVNQSQRGPQQRFFRNRFQPIRNEFLGLLGSQLRQGQLPTQRFTDFLNSFDFNRRFRSTAPSLRGQGDRTRFAPPVRFR